MLLAAFAQSQRGKVLPVNTASPFDRPAWLRVNLPSYHRHTD
jgi:hypothetical protein